MKIGPLESPLNGLLLVSQDLLKFNLSVKTGTRQYKETWPLVVVLALWTLWLPISRVGF